MISSRAYQNFFSFQDSKDASLLESSEKRKSRLKRKGSKRKKDLQEADGEIEAVLKRKGALRVLGGGRGADQWAQGVASSVPALVPGPAVCSDVCEKNLHCPMDLGFLRHYSVEF